MIKFKSRHLLCFGHFLKILLKIVFAKQERYKKIIEKSLKNTVESVIQNSRGGGI